MRYTATSVGFLALVWCVLSGPAICLGQQNAAPAVAPKSAMLPSPMSSWSTAPKPGQTQHPPLSLEVPTDKPQVVVEVAQLLVDLNSDVPLKSFFKPGSFEVHNGTLPPVDLESKLGVGNTNNIGNSPSSTAKSAEGTQSVRRSMPVMLAKLDDEGMAGIKGALKDESVVSAPTLVCFSGQSATINDLSLRPFVVGVKPISNNGTVAHQPIIQTIEDGLLMNFTPTIVDGNIDLTTNLAHSKVTAVETFRISGNTDQGVTIQIPEQSVSRVRLSSLLKNGESLFVDPRLQVEVEQAKDSKLPFGKSKTETVSKQVYFLVTARVVIPDGELASSLTQAK